MFEHMVMTVEAVKCKGVSCQIVRLPHAELTKRALDSNSGILACLTLNNRVDRVRGSSNCKGLGGNALGQETESCFYVAGENSVRHRSLMRDENKD